MALPCSHAFHRDCLLQWLQQCHSQARGAACPMCQQAIPLAVHYRMPWQRRRPPSQQQQQQAAAARRQEADLAAVGAAADGAAGGLPFGGEQPPAAAAAQQPPREEEEQPGDGMPGLQALVQQLQVWGVLTGCCCCLIRPSCGAFM